jgi:tetratricopeptide (TPR) repeat protein
VTVIVSAAVVLALLAATAWALRRRLEVAFLGVWIVLILAPTSSFWPILTEAAAERRMYLPLAALIALAVVGGRAAVGRAMGRLGWTPARRRLVDAALLGVIVAVLAQATVRRNEVYRSPEVFWEDVLAKRPENARAHNNLGEYLYRQGRAAAAFDHLSEAVRLDPTDAHARNNMGLVLADRGLLDEAIARYVEALGLSPAFPEAQNNLGNALSAGGRLDEAIVHYAEALRLEPDYPEVHYNLATALTKQGKLDEAIVHYAEALRLNPDDARSHGNLGVTLARQGRLIEAAAHLSSALRIAPTAETHYNLAAVLALTGDGDAAAQHLRAALELDPGFEPARRALERLGSASAPRRE